MGTELELPQPPGNLEKHCPGRARKQNAMFPLHSKHWLCCEQLCGRHLSHATCEPMAAEVCLRLLISQQESLLVPQFPPRKPLPQGTEGHIFMDLINALGNLRSQSWHKRGMWAGDYGICWGWNMTCEKPRGGELPALGWPGDHFLAAGFRLFILLIKWVNSQASLTALCALWSFSSQPPLLSFPPN